MFIHPVVFFRLHYVVHWSASFVVEIVREPVIEIEAIAASSDSASLVAWGECAAITIEVERGALFAAWHLTHIVHAVALIDGEPCSIEWCLAIHR